MPRIRTEKPQGALTSESEKEPNNLVPANAGLGRGTPARRRRGGLAQEETSPGVFSRIQSHYSANSRVYNLAGAGLAGFVLGMLVSN